jgi:hypothetical protein
LSDIFDLVDRGWDFCAPQFDGEEFALLHVEAPVRFDLPFVKTRTTKSFVVGAEAAGVAQFDDGGDGLSAQGLISPCPIPIPPFRDNVCVPFIL